MIPSSSSAAEEESWRPATVTGSHDGPLGPFPATGKGFALPLCEMWHFDSLLRQLGLMPRPFSAEGRFRDPKRGADRFRIEGEA